ncbi:MAG TPA: mandelate racemase/muconate lactonizing enzyme family protein [Chthonomonadaceae bacterium]|nr:mandelate racemase/muconate lactonizing enzyme family protein [Chthonomonadaceae bacterium]
MKSLQITDLRTAVVTRAPMTCPLIRIDTNQEGLYGLGEVRDGASATYALFLKSRLVGENPLDVDRLFRKIKQFGHHARQGGGVCAVEMALWDIVGKYYGVPVYQLLGGKFRDKIRIYADTDLSPEPAETAKRLQKRLDQGFTFLKMDFMGRASQDEIATLYGRLKLPPGMTLKTLAQTQHMFTGLEIGEAAIQQAAEYVAEVRRLIGPDVPLAADHFGHIGVNSCIRLGRALESYHLAWLEDLIPWQQTALWKRITEAIQLPTCTGEDIYLKEGFVELCRHHAVDIIHPDLATSGGILETKKIGDMAQDFGVPMAMHFAGTPVSCMANVHCAAATENFLVLENHSVDIPWWDDLVEGIEKPIVKDGFITVPDKPGLGITLKEEVVREHLREGSGYFEPTPEWDNERSSDRLWS